MAWTYASPAPAARHYAGNNGVQFTSCSFQVQLVDSGGAVLGSATLNKTWGVTPGFSTLSAALPMPPRGYRLRVKGSLYGYVPGIGTAPLAGEWTEQLRWGSP